MRDPAIIASILISAIAALGAYASNRASSRALIKNNSTSSRVEMEKEAYERARALDTETIKRQDAEIDELRDMLKALNEDVKMVNRENDALHAENRRVLRVNEEVLRDNARLHVEVNALRLRFTRFQRGLPPDSNEEIHERAADTNPMIPEVKNDGGE